MPGFNASVGPRSAVVAGNYVVRAVAAVQTQVVLQGVAGKEIWLGLDIRKGEANITGWVKAGCRVASCRGGWHGMQAMVTGWQGGGETERQGRVECGRTQLDVQ